MRSILILIMVLSWSCSGQQDQKKHDKQMKIETKHKYSNSLIHETSPYLLQHAHNPVNWYAWNKEAFDKAKKENKLVLISIGYAACHWCHVMEHESFENEEIAQIMNEHYVCIKVDREERPDVDQIYMNAVQLLTGSGGWPLNCFALPDGRPIYGGTYFRPNQWKDVLLGLNETFVKDYSRIEAAAKEISEGVANSELIKVKSDIPEFSADLLHKATENWQTNFDTEWGGDKRAPKFALPSSLTYLHEYNYNYKKEQISTHLKTTLNKMAYGGIYDQVGGGFARYSVDKEWKAPHFEKMLYDNGQLVSLYANAYKQSKSPLYKKVITQTLDFIEREMTTKEGAFYASFDADSEGVEGKFYVWEKQELEILLKDDAAWFCDYFNVTEQGNWEHANILWVTQSELLSVKYNFTEKEIETKLDETLNKLLKVRSQRIYPGLDDKALTSWNALMSKGYFDAYEALGEGEYLKIALSNCRFIENTLLQADGQLFRNYKNRKTTIPAFLDDYALSIELFNKAYRNTFDPHWLEVSKKLTHYVIDHFYDTKSGMFFYSSDLTNDLITRKMELSDNVIPASNSIMANNLFHLGTVLNQTEWSKLAMQMLANMQKQFEQSMPYYANWGILQNKLSSKQYELVIIGKDAARLQNEFLKHYYPNVILAGSHTEQNNLPLTENRWLKGETLIYVCENNACQLPVKTLEEALKLIK